MKNCPSQFVTCEMCSTCPSLSRAERCVTFREAESEEEPSTTPHQSVLLFLRYPYVGLKYVVIFQMQLLKESEGIRPSKVDWEWELIFLLRSVLLPACLTGSTQLEASF